MQFPEVNKNYNPIPQQENNNQPLQGVVFATGTSGMQPQHMAAQYMVAATTQPLPTAPWGSNLCDWTKDINGCIEVTCCAPCQKSRQYNMMHYGKSDIEILTCLIPIAVDSCFGIPVLTTTLTWYLRNKVRARYQIVGDDLSDLMIAVCCGPCSTCQVYREMSYRGEWPTGCCLKPYDIPQPPTVSQMVTQ